MKKITSETDVISPNYQILLVISTNLNDFVSNRIQMVEKVTEIKNPEAMKIICFGVFIILKLLFLTKRKQLLLYPRNPISPK